MNQIHHPVKQWKVLNRLGPERICTDWWSKEPIERDYYCIATEEGEKLWIFIDRDQTPPQAFLHGYFD